MITFNRRVVTALGILIFIGVFAIFFKVHEMNSRLGDLESSIDDQAGETARLEDSLNDQESEIENIRSDVDDLQSQR